MPTLVPVGDTLAVSFWLGRAKNTTGGQGDAYFDVGGTKYTMAFDTTALPDDSWRSYTLTKTITHSGSLSLGFYGTSKANSWLDKISDVTVTPAVVDAKAPKCAGATITTLEDTPKRLAAGNFGYSDPHASPLAAVQITSLPTHGTLKLGGTPNTVDLGDAGTRQEEAAGVRRAEPSCSMPAPRDPGILPGCLFSNNPKC